MKNDSEQSFKCVYLVTAHLGYILVVHKGRAYNFAAEEESATAQKHGDHAQSNSNEPCNTMCVTQPTNVKCSTTARQP